MNINDIPPAILSLASGLLGSSITLVITKIIEGVNARRAFKRELQKHWFLRKVQAAEEGYTFLVSHLSSIRAQRASMTTLNDLAKKGELQQETVKKFTELAKGLATLNSEKMNLLFLYFDMPDAIKGDHKPQNLLELINKMSAIDTNTNLEESKEQLLDELRNIINWFQNMEENTVLMINTVKKQIRKNLP